MPASAKSAPACCDFVAAQRLQRRDVLRAGGLSALGLTLPELLRARAQAEPIGRGTFGRAKQVILLFLHGGHPQQETFDPKPHGPSAVRGEFGAIETSLPGMQFSEVLPLTARIAHKLAVIRSMTHGNANHVQACLPANTGHKHPESVQSRGDFPPSEHDFPPFGAVVDHLASRPDAEGIRETSRGLPNWVRIGPLMRRNNGTILHGQLPGFLGQQHSSFVVDQPLLGDDVRIDAIQPIDELTSLRISARRNLLTQIDRQRRAIDSVAEAASFGRQAGSLPYGDEATTLDAFYQRAFNLLTSAETRRAFQLAEERPEVREQYGQTEFSQRCLLARRLAQAGVPMVNVSYCHKPPDSWDTHSRHFRQTKERLAPTFDRAFTALVSDLDERGLLDETLVIATAEFGRTPKINKNAGRDHWPWVYSIALAGAGVKPGTIHGSSDDSAAYPTADPHDPADFAATLYHLLGIPPDTNLHDAQNRPHRLVIGQVIEGILA